RIERPRTRPQALGVERESGDACGVDDAAKVEVQRLDRPERAPDVQAREDPAPGEGDDEREGGAEKSQASREVDAGLAREPCERGCRVPNVHAAIDVEARRHEHVEDARATASL